MEWSGFGFGELNDHKIQAALKKVAFDNDVKEVSFWGKILGQHNDYWVIQGKLKKHYNENVEYQGQEPNG